MWCAETKLGKEILSFSIIFLPSTINTYSQLPYRANFEKKILSFFKYFEWVFGSMFMNLKSKIAIGPVDSCQQVVKISRKDKKMYGANYWTFWIINPKSKINVNLMRSVNKSSIFLKKLNITMHQFFLETLTVSWPLPLRKNSFSLHNLIRNLHKRHFLFYFITLYNLLTTVIISRYVVDFRFAVIAPKPIQRNIASIG